MIPPTLAAFRKLMERAAIAHDESAKVAIYFARYAKPEDDLEGFVKLSYADSATLRTIATATPEQLLGIVGSDVRCVTDWMGTPANAEEYLVLVPVPREDA